MTTGHDSPEEKIEFPDSEDTEIGSVLSPENTLDEHEEIQVDPDLPNRETPDRSKIYSVGDSIEGIGEDYSNNGEITDPFFMAGFGSGVTAGAVPIMLAAGKGPESMMAGWMGGFIGGFIGGPAASLAREGSFAASSYVGDTIEKMSSNIDQGTEYDAQQIKDELSGLEDPNFTVQEDEDRRLASTEEVYGFLDSLEDPSSELEVEEYAVTELNSGDIAVGIKANEYDGDKLVDEKEIGIFAETPYEEMNRSLGDSVSEIPDDFSNYNGHR